MFNTALRCLSDLLTLTASHNLNEFRRKGTIIITESALLISVNQQLALCSEEKGRSALEQYFEFHQCPLLPPFSCFFQVINVQYWCFKNHELRG